MKYQLTQSYPIPDIDWGKRPKFPLMDMKAGDSFWVPIQDDDPNAVVSAVCRFKKKHKAFKFTTRRDDSGIRVWRIK